MHSSSNRLIRTASVAFFDLETTALRPDRGGYICEIAVVNQAGIQFQWSGDEDPPADAAVRKQIPRIRTAFQNSIVVGHNLQFDLHFLTYEAERLGQKGFEVRFADTLGMARRLFPNRDQYQLEVLVNDMNVETGKPLHTAVGDALATRGLFWHLVEAGDWETLSDVGVKRLSWNVQ